MQLFESAEEFWEWFGDKPLRIILILVIGLIALGLVNRTISHLTERIAEGVTRARSTGQGRAPGAPGSPQVVVDAPAGTLPVGTTTAARPKRRRRTSQELMADAFSFANPVAIQRRAQRARTVGSVLRSTADITILSLMALMILATLGVNVAALLGVAGILGVAVGFGAQSLVKDFISGIFLLVEDQFGVGDNVDLGNGVNGTVQELGLRLTQVRAFDGTLWYVRNGEILRVGNRTQEWSRALASVQVPVGADVDTVRTALGRAADKVQHDPNLADHLLEAPSVRGVDAVDAASLTFTLHVQTRPAKQWEVERALRLAAHHELRGAGIIASSAPVEVPGVQ